MARLPDLTVPLSRRECADRVNSGTDPWWSLFGKRQVIGKLGRGGGTLSWRRLYSRNSFQPRLRVRFKEVEGGTRVRCRIGVSRFVVGFLLFWFSIVLTMAWYLTLPYLVALAQGRAPADGAMGAMGPVMMLGFGAVVVVFGGMLHRSDGPMLVRFLHKKLEGGDARQYFDGF